MSNAFGSYSTGLTAPVTTGFEIVPNDNADLAQATRQIRVTGQGGQMAVVWLSGVQTIEPVLAGETLDWRILRILATNTTATGLRGYA
jgi:hypothetical protein